MKKLSLILTLILMMAILGAEIRQSLVGADSLSIGTPFSLVIQTDFPISEVVIPDSLSSFRVLHTDIRQQGEGSRAELRIVPLGVGALSFPKLDLKARGLLRFGGSTDAFRVYVLATRAEADSLLRDIKPPERYRWQLPFWLYLIIFLGCLVLASILIIKAFTKKARPTPAPKPIPSTPKKIVPAYKVALRKLDALEQSALAETDPMDYHYQLSMILREFLEHGLYFNAMEMTTTEIEGMMRILKPPNATELLDILRYCDRVKFARMIPTPEQIRSQTQALRICLLQAAREHDV